VKEIYFENCFDKNFFYALKKINYKTPKKDNNNLLSLNIVNKNNLSIYSAYS